MTDWRRYADEQPQLGSEVWLKTPLTPLIVGYEMTRAGPAWVVFPNDHWEPDPGDVWAPLTATTDA